MTFQAYLDNIHAQTGLWPDDFLAAAKARGLISEDVKVMAIVAWLKSDYVLGHGHAMAIVQAFRNAGAIASPPAKPRPAGQKPADVKPADVTPAD